MPNIEAVSMLNFFSFPKMSSSAECVCDTTLVDQQALSQKVKNLELFFHYGMFSYNNSKKGPYAVVYNYS